LLEGVGDIYPYLFPTGRKIHPKAMTKIVQLVGLEANIENEPWIKHGNSSREVSE
jgi:hypothetical protein